MGEMRILRDRHAAMQDALDGAPDAPPFGAGALLVETFEEKTYPTDAAAFYACHVVAINGQEKEGIQAVYVTDTGTTLYVWNAGNTIPPNPTRAVAHAVGGRWVMRFD